MFQFAELDLSDRLVEPKTYYQTGCQTEAPMFSLVLVTLQMVITDTPAPKLSELNIRYVCAYCGHFNSTYQCGHLTLLAFPNAHEKIIITIHVLWGSSIKIHIVIFMNWLCSRRTQCEILFV